MGFYRLFYNIMGWDYYGTKESDEYKKQSRLKHLLHKELLNTDLNKMLFKIKTKKKTRKRFIPMGILIKKGI
jgi:hypothetical protein